MVNIDAQGISVLIKGNWPLLQELSLCLNCFSVAWLPQLSWAAWLVWKFSIALFDPSYPSRFGWHPNGTAAAISRLRRVDWQSEESLFPDTDRLCISSLSINVIQSLVKRHEVTDRRRLDRIRARWLVYCEASRKQVASAGQALLEHSHP